jgi:hypothetical protein
MTGFHPRLNDFEINHKIMILKELPPSTMVTRKPKGPQESV